MKTFLFCGAAVAAINRQTFLEKIGSGVGVRPGKYVFTLNTQHIYLLRKDLEFKKAYDSAGIVVADGMSVVFGLKLTGRKLPERLCGADLFPGICALAESAGRKVFVLGGRGDSSERAAEKLSREFKTLEVYIYQPPDGFENRDDAEIIRRVNEVTPDFLVVCAGSPKSEKWLYKNMPDLRVSWAFSFGAALDFYLGTKERAPGWMRESGLEWFFRLHKEPGRLWKRYLVSNLFFLIILISEISKKALGK